MKISSLSLATVAFFAVIIASGCSSKSPDASSGSSSPVNIASNAAPDSGTSAQKLGNKGITTTQTLDTNVKTDGTANTGQTAKVSSPESNSVQISPKDVPAGSYLLTLKPSSGKVDTYTVTTVNPTKAGKSVTSRFHLKVTYDKVAPNKIRRTTQITSFDLDKLLAATPASQRAQVQKKLSSQATAIEKLKTVEDMTATGRFIDIHVDGGPKGMKQPSATQGISLIVFPNNALKVGDTWQSPMGQDEVKCTLVKVDTEGGKKVAVVKIESTISSKSSSSGSRTAKFDLSDGTLVSSHIVQSQTISGKTYTQTTDVVRN